MLRLDRSTPPAIARVTVVLAIDGDSPSALSAAAFAVRVLQQRSLLVLLLISNDEARRCATCRRACVSALRAALHLFPALHRLPLLQLLLACVRLRSEETQMTRAATLAAILLI